MDNEELGRAAYEGYIATNAYVHGPWSSVQLEVRKWWCAAAQAVVNKLYTPGERQAVPADRPVEQAGTTKRDPEFTASIIARELAGAFSDTYAPAQAASAVVEGIGVLIDDKIAAALKPIQELLEIVRRTHTI